MADKKSFVLTTGMPGIEIAIWYNDVNLRIGVVTWQVDPPGYAARIQIWDSNVDPEVPVLDRTEGQGSGSENVPGNYSLVEKTDPDIGTYLSLPDNIWYRFQVRSI